MAIASTARRLVFGSLVLVAVPALLVDGCRTATQVTIDVTTTGACADVTNVEITVAGSVRDVEQRVASRFPTTNAPTCNPTGPKSGSFGTLVVTPGADSAAVMVVASFLRPTAKCEPPLFEGCIVARRRFSFADHVASTLPIVLDPDCVGVLCTATTTCVGRACVDSEVVCEGDTCTAPGMNPDGTPKPIEGGSDAVVEGDVPDATAEASFDGADASGDASPDQVSGLFGQCPLTMICPDPAGTPETCNIAGGETCCIPENDRASCKASGACTANLAACCTGSDQCDKAAGYRCCANFDGPPHVPASQIACSKTCPLVHNGVEGYVCDITRNNGLGQCPSHWVCGATAYVPNKIYFCDPL